MIGRTAAAIANLSFALTSVACVHYYEVPVEVPIQAKIDVTRFERVLVAGFLAGGTRTIDPNTETARLLRSQLRNRQDMRVIEADVIALADEVDKQRNTAPADPKGDPRIRSEEDLKAYEQIFRDAEYWKKVGQEFDNPLIVTGSILFTEVSKSGMVTRPQMYVDPQGIEQYRSVPQFADLKGYALTPRFVFIDGKTGAEIYSETYHEEALYPTGQNTPALSSYFELMDKLLPSVLNTLSTQKIRGTRTLLK
jgi:hypothetical protein